MLDREHFAASMVTNRAGEVPVSVERAAELVTPDRAVVDRAMPSAL
jgi:hypothetical protein